MLVKSLGTHIGEKMLTEAGEEDGLEFISVVDEVMDRRLNEAVEEAIVMAMGKV